MLPEERACFIDLLIYQHQNGPIPLYTKRMLMYCSGVNEATLQATLQAKFKQTDKGWVNEKLLAVMDDRSTYKGKQSDNGVLGQFFKKAKSQCKAAEYKALRTYIYEDYGKENLINELKKEQTTHEGLLKALLKHLANGVGNENEDESKDVVKYFEHEKLNSEFHVFIKHRKEKRNPLTPTAIKRQVAKLEKETPETAIKMLNQSIENGWAGVFDLKETKEAPRFPDITNDKYYPDP